MAGKVIRVAVDMDEVLYSWERTARYLLRNEWATGPEWMYWDKVVQPFKEWALPDLIGQAAYEWLFDEGVQLGLFRHGHVITGAMRGVRALKAAGRELVIVTHRPENGVQDTLAWIDFHFGREDPYPWSGVYILSNGELKTEVKWDVIIDDSLQNINDAASSCPPRGGILFGAAWNGGHVNWDDVVRVLT